MRKLGLGIFFLSVLSAASPLGAAHHEDPLDAALASEYRTAEEKARDVYRHPRETLEFFAVKPDMAIVEINPGAGWYSNILAPLVRERGRYTAVWTDPEFYADTYPDYAKRAAGLPAKLKADPEKYGANAHGAFVVKGDIAPDASIDMVLGIRFMHGWIGQGMADKALANLHRALKPGGTFAVVQHRADESDPRDAAALAAKGYVKQSHMIELMGRHGFELAAKSEINANPKDTKDYADGVWTLPPSLRLGDKDKDKYLSIGESDRMTLRFTKSK